VETDARNGGARGSRRTFGGTITAPAWLLSSNCAEKQVNDDLALMSQSQ
jgi:hypothetical protein